MRMAGRAGRAIPFGLAALGLAGCKMSVLEPMGRVGVEERDLIITAFILMLLVVIPVIAMAIIFPIRFRASNTKVEHRPNWSHSVKLEFVVWGVPCLIILALSVLTWRTTHALDPYKPIDGDRNAVQIQVVAEDWKWLFIYPQYGIATINEIAIPVGVPIAFHITSDSVMNSFFIPALGSQIYAMAGMETQDHLIADHPGVIEGRSANYSGRGFSDMRFGVIATTQAKFQQWIQSVKGADNALTDANYGKVLAPSEKVPPTYFSSVQKDLFDQIIAKYQDKLVNFHSSLQESP